MPVRQNENDAPHSGECAYTIIGSEPQDAEAEEAVEGGAFLDGHAGPKAAVRQDDLFDVDVRYLEGPGGVW